MRRKVAILVAMVAMVLGNAVPAFAHTDNSINAGKRSQVAVNNSSNSVNQNNLRQNANQTAINTGSGSIGQGANAVVTKQKQNNQNFQARNSFNRYHR